MNAYDLDSSKALPIFEKKEEILNLIRGNHVSILESDVGSGKSTQVPQYILDDSDARGEKCRIVCTQPQNIAAITLAQRVCEERKCLIGTLVGYQISLKDDVDQKTMRLVYCTPQILLECLIQPKVKQSFTHIILDELHERTLDMDFLLILLSSLLDTNFKNVKIILMSATFDTIKFANYFKVCQRPAPILKISSASKYTVCEYYLNDLERMINANCGEIDSNPEVTKEMYIFAFKLLLYITNKEKHEFKLNHLMSVLIFLPGAKEVNIIYNKLDEYNKTNQSKWCITTFQSLTSSQKKFVEQKSVTGCSIKIILATSEAESSITIPDVKYVIDFCLVKSLVNDPATNFSSFQMDWATQANCRQRAGRTGRLMDGYVYRLIPHEFYKKNFKEFNESDMLRGPLAQVILKAKILNLASPACILSMAVDPPNYTNVQNTILTLKGLGALCITLNGQESVENGDLTFIGHIMAKLPLDIRLSRLIVFGYIFHVLDEAIIIAAGLMVRTLFKFDNSNPHLNLNAHIQKLAWAEGSGSDLFAILNAYKMWIFLREHNMLDKYNEATWVNKYYIDLPTIMEMHVLIEDINERLKTYDLWNDVSCSGVLCLDFQRDLVLKIIIAGAFYPNYFLYSSDQGILNERIANRILNGKEPYNMVYFKNFNKNNIGELYAQQIKELFKRVKIDPEVIKLKFPKDTENILVSFNGRTIESNYTFDNYIRVPGCITSEVYKAVGLRASKLPNIIKVMQAKHDVDYALKHNYIKKVGDKFELRLPKINDLDSNVLSTIFEKKIRGRITHVENCGKFFFLPLSEMMCVKKFEEYLNDPQFGQMLPFKHASDIAPGTILSAQLNAKFRRGKFINTLYTEKQKLRFQIWFLDNGSTSLSKFGNLRQITMSELKISTRVIQCRLAMIQPFVTKSQDGIWCEEANKLLQHISEKGSIEIEIYSVVNDIASVYVSYKNTTLNDILIQQNFAKSVDESFLSKMDHDSRIRKQLKQNIDCVSKKQIGDSTCITDALATNLMMKIQPPPEKLCDQIIRLEGPFSTLEAKITSLQKASIDKQISISKHSINSILLDTYSYDIKKKMLVAACVRQHPDCDRVILQDTILMPNIDGFAALVAMLFCPIVQIKCNPKRTRYTEILVGLGCKTSTQQALFSQFDMVIPIDVNFQFSDFEMINQLRHSMDALLFIKPGEHCPSIPSKDRLELQLKITDLIFRIFGRTRKSICLYDNPKSPEWESNLDDTNTMKTKQNSLNGLTDRLIFPEFNVARLDNENTNFTRRVLIEHCKELHYLRRKGEPIQSMICLLCNEPLENILQLNLHLLSKLHLDMEGQIISSYPCP